MNNFKAKRPFHRRAEDASGIRAKTGTRQARQDHQQARGGLQSPLRVMLAAIKSRFNINFPPQRSTMRSTGRTTVHRRAKSSLTNRDEFDDHTPFIPSPNILEEPDLEESDTNDFYPNDGIRTGHDEEFDTRSRAVSPTDLKESSSLHATSHLLSKLKLKKLYRAIPIVFLFMLSSQITTPAAIDLLRKIACEMWFRSNEPEKIPADGQVPQELCQLSGAEKIFSTLLTSQIVLQSVGAIVASALIGRYAKRYGRRPVTIFWTLIPMCTNLLFFMALRVHGIPQIAFLTFTGLVGALGTYKAIVLLANMYVTDLATPIERTSVIGLSYAAVAVASAPSFAIGGAISRYSSHPLTVYFVSFGLNFLTTAYTYFCLPESYSREKANIADRCSREDDDVLETVEHGNVFSRAMLPFYFLIGPIKLLLPTRHKDTGRMNFRLPVVACSLILASISTAQISATFLVYSSAKFNFRPDETGYTLSIVATGKILFMALCLPAILRWGRPLFNRQLAHQNDPVAREDGGSYNEGQGLLASTEHDCPPSPGSPLTSFRSPQDYPHSPMGTGQFPPSPRGLRNHHYPPSRNEQEDLSTPSKVTESVSSRFDVIIAFTSFSWDTFTMILVTLSPSRYLLTGSMVLLSFGAGGIPVMQSVAVASVAPESSGEILSAVQMAVSIFEVPGMSALSTILTLTISTVPKLTFLLCSGIMGLAAFLVLFIKDSDRYQPFPELDLPLHLNEAHNDR